MIQLFDFFEKLNANNNRPWFLEHKPEYQDIRAEWIAGIERTIAALGAEAWPEVRHASAAQCTYRIYRDVRFSNDKRPYKTYISSSITPPADRNSHTGIYVQAGLPADDCGIYGGIWCPDAAVLRKLRRAMEDNAEEWLEIVNNPRLIEIYGTRWVGDRLKTAPKGYDRDHPLIEYLRLKDIGKFTVTPHSLYADSQWPLRLAEMMLPLVPLNRFLLYSIHED